MRTTLTIDDDVLIELRRRSRAAASGFKGVVNETLRRGLSVGETPSSAQPPFEVRAKSCGFLPGIDPLRLNQLADELEVDEFIATHSRLRSQE